MSYLLVVLLLLGGGVNNPPEKIKSVVFSIDGVLYPSPAKVIIKPKVIIIKTKAKISKRYNLDTPRAGSSEVYLSSKFEIVQIVRDNNKNPLELKIQGDKKILLTF